MDKSEFVESADVPKSLAESAWEEADGDERVAEDLISPEQVKVKAKFMDPDDGFYGLFSFVWKYQTGTISNQNQVVIGNDEVEGISTSKSFTFFNQKIDDLIAKGSSMGGSTEQLEESIGSALSDSSSSLVQALENESFGDLDDILENVVKTALELDSVRVGSDAEVVRKIEHMTDVEPVSTGSSSSADEDETLYLQCSVRINPVKGVPVAKISPGDSIFVNMAESGDKHRNLIEEIESRANDDGMIPAELTSKRRTDAGNLRLEVKFMDNVMGTVSCGNDVSILVPDETKFNLSGSSSDLPAFLTDEIFIGTAIAILVILLIGLWFFLP